MLLRAAFVPIPSYLDLSGNSSKDIELTFLALITGVRHLNSGSGPRPCWKSMTVRLVLRFYSFSLCLYCFLSWILSFISFVFWCFTIIIEDVADIPVWLRLWIWDSLWAAGVLSPDFGCGVLISSRPYLKSCSVAGIAALWFRKLKWFWALVGVSTLGDYKTFRSVNSTGNNSARAFTCVSL